MIVINFTILMFSLLMWISSFIYWYEEKNKESLTCFLIGVVLFISVFG
jgi:hypothetical protein|nr:MAG TPA: hypothetical protein [Caudoviricetes sp.]